MAGRGRSKRRPPGPREHQALVDPPADRLGALLRYLNNNDAYPDVRPCLTELRERGYFVGIAGNQTVRAGRFIRELNLPADIIATSDDWGASRPSVDFSTSSWPFPGMRQTRSST